MELVYADSNGKELGIILDFDMDTAIGKDENTFQVTIPLSNHCCSNGYRIYIDNTEMGGIIDTISPNTEDDTVIYEGRTWHGILENKIIEPLANQDYYSVQGEANTVITGLINYLELSNLFTVSTATSTITINYYQFERYVNGFTGICKMLFASNGKLVVEYANKTVNLSVIPLYDYSESEEFDSSQVDFTIERNYRPVNHLICLGSGDLKDRKVIHLFTDENGGIQQYSTVTIPYQDSHYILDKSSQVLFYQDEVTDVLDYPNADLVYNYILLESKPTNWDNWQLSTSFVMYYTQNSDGKSFTQNELEYADNYYVLTAQPSDWLYDYGDYYYLDGETYKSVEGVEGISYDLQTSQPSDWTTNYQSYYYYDGGYLSVASVEVSNYTILVDRPSDWDSIYSNCYYYYFDGIEWSYERVNGISKTKYNVQTGQPSDWNENYDNYYYKKAIKKYKYLVKTKVNKKWVKSYEYYDTKIANSKTSTLIKKYIKKVTYEYQYTSVPLTSAGKVPTWKAKKYYTSESYTIPPEFVTNYYYILNTSTTYPTWQTSTYYTKNIGETAPTWQASTYYKKINEPVILEFVTNQYYQRFEDNYYTLVQKGLDSLQKSYDCDTIDINLDTDYEYDINDIIGANEEITGISIFQPIIKKIYKIKNDIETISYEIGVW